jgi:predicted nucleotidyltransferase
MKTKTKYISQLIRQNIELVDPKAEVILYGSRARGDERVDSDWDILVLTDYPVDLNKERMFRDKLYDLELEMGEPFSIFVYSKKDWFSRQRITPFYQNVTREGIRL